MTTDFQHLAEKKKKVILSYIFMFLCGIGIVLTAITIAQLLNTFYPLPYVYIRICEYTGYIGWCSTLGMVGWEIQTWDGDTPPERLNQALMKVFTFVGIFAFVLSRELVSL